MALIWFDGFETYNNDADMNALKNSVFSSVISDGVTYGTYGRRSTRGIKMYYDKTLTWIMADNYASFFYGIAVYRDFVGLPTYNASYPFLGFYDDTTLQIGFYVVGTEIHVYRGTTKIGETVGAGIDYQTWRYIEVEVTINNTTGAVEIRADENEVMTPLSGIDTQVSVNAYFNVLKLRGLHLYASPSYFDDFYMCDLTGAKNNDFLGDVRVDTIRPDGEGTYSANFTPSSAGDNNLMVDETYPDDDTTYNQGSSVGDKDTYTLGALPSPSASTTIHGVKSQITVRKTDAGSRECKILTRAGTTDALGDALVLSESYLTPTKIYEDNPADSAAWEDADVNGMEVGVEITV